MRARFTGGPADGLEFDIRGDRDSRPGTPPRILAVIAVLEYNTGGTWRIPMEFPQWADQQLLNLADGLWADYIADDPGDDWPSDKPVDFQAASGG